MSTDQRIKLEGQAAIELWQQGKDAWNHWVEEHPEADIDFSCVDFGRYRVTINNPIPANKWPFAGFQFPKGVVDFYGAKFGEGEVSLARTRIQGDFHLSHATLGESTYTLKTAILSGTPSSIALKAQSTLSPFLSATRALISPLFYPLTTMPPSVV